MKNKVLNKYILILVCLLCISILSLQTNVRAAEPSVASGSGSETDPYIITSDCIVKYEKIPFYFQVNDSSDSGQYFVEQNEEEKQVTFKKISDERRVLCYFDESQPLDQYIQAGTVSDRLANLPANPKYIIKTGEEFEASLFQSIGSILEDIFNPSRLTDEINTSINRKCTNWNNN